MDNHKNFPLIQWNENIRPYFILSQVIMKWQLWFNPFNLHSMLRLVRFILVVLFLASFSVQMNAQMDIYIQANSFYSNNSELESIQLGAEAGLAFKKWDLAVLAQRGFTLDVNNTNITPSRNLFLGGAIARKLNLKLIGFRFPFLAGMSSVDFNDTSAIESYLTLSPGAQICMGKYRTQIGVGYQYFWYLDAPEDLVQLDSESLSAFIRIKLF